MTLNFKESKFTINEVLSFFFLLFAGGGGGGGGGHLAGSLESLAVASR